MLVHFICNKVIKYLGKYVVVGAKTEKPKSNWNKL